MDEGGGRLWMRGEGGQGVGAVNEGLGRWCSADLAVAPPVDERVDAVAQVAHRLPIERLVIIEAKGATRRLLVRRRLWRVGPRVLDLKLLEDAVDAFLEGIPGGGERAELGEGGIRRLLLEHVEPHADLHARARDDGLSGL